MNAHTSPETHENCGKEDSNLHGVAPTRPSIGLDGQAFRRLRMLADYLDDPSVLLQIPQPHRMKISQLLHCEDEVES